MAKRLFVLASAAALVAGLSAPALGESKLGITDKVVPYDQLRLMNDPPASHLNGLDRGARVDTTYYGGEDVDGLAFAGGIWDFEDGTLQGWFSRDLTDKPTYFRRITRADDDLTGSPTEPVINGEASVWCGAWQDEAEEMCWPGGMGYGNGWSMFARKTFEYGGSGSVGISFDYFTDSETQFDFTYVYVEVGGIRSEPLNTSAFPNDDGFGYSGAIDEGTNIGLPTDPAFDNITIDQADLPGGAGEEFDILFNFDSDPLYSDDLDSFSGFLNSRFGPFGFDDFAIIGTGLSDTDTFEGGAEGWTFFVDDPIGSLTQVAALADLDPIADPCTCPITSDPDNDYVMIAASLNPLEFPHPKRQNEWITSNPAYVGPGSGVEDRVDRGLLWDVWEDTPLTNGVGYRITMDFYPWECPETGVVGWTLQPGGDGGFHFTGLGGAQCVTFIANLSSYIPSAIESIRVVYELLGDCDDFGQDNCTGPDLTNQSPYWDNIVMFFAGQDVSAPTATVDISYQDAFPRQNTLFPNAVANVYAYYDNNRADDDPTNANMGDSIVVIAGTEPGTEVYLNFRVWPGPAMDTDGDDVHEASDQALYTDGRYTGSPLAPSWAKARMDTAEVMTGIVNGSYSSYFWPNGQEDIANQKIIPNGVLTPGTAVEYFFSTNFSSTPGEVRVVPDTTDAFFLEFEVLPGYVKQSDDFVTSQFLYVDAFNNGAQVPIEDIALDTYFGQGVDDFGATFDRWDRYDYVAASSNVPAPLAREANGDNGMTKYQSMVYRCMLYNTGTFREEGLRNGDADLLTNWLINDDFDRWSVRKGLWLSGNGMATILDRSDRPDANNLLASFVQATIVSEGDGYLDITGDSALCVRLDPSSGRHFPSSGPGAVTYSAVRGNGCPTLLDFQVVLPALDSTGDIEYVDQDGVPGAGVTQYASVSNDQFAPGNPANYGVVMDAFSVHYLRSVPEGWDGGTDNDCGQDSTAIFIRTNDVLTWFGCPGGAAVLWDPSDIFIGVEDPSSAPVARTMLFQNSPNPFNPRTTVRYSLATDAAVKLQIFDVNGRLVRTLVDGAQVRGDYNVQWDGITESGEAVASGVYWARMSTDRGFKSSTKMVVLK